MITDRFAEGFQNGAYIVGAIAGTFVYGLAIMTLIGVVWSMRDAITKRKKYRKWG